MCKKTKVMILLAQLNAGGIQKFAIDLAQNLDKEKFETCILSLMPRTGTVFEQKAAECGLHVWYLHKRKGMDPAVIPQLYRAIRQYQPDVIHANQRTLTYALLPIRLLGIQNVLYTVHNLAEHDASGIHKQILRLANTRYGIPLVAISDICKRSIAQVYGIPAEKIPCIYNGVDVTQFAPLPTATQLPAATQKDIDFLAVGRMSAQKNYPLLLSAFKHVHGLYPTVRLTILGDGEKRAEIEAFCQANGLQGFVDMPGNVSNVCDYMRRAKVFLMSSDYEGLPITVLEAMAAALPVISTRAGGVPDIVQDGVNGRLAAIGDTAGLAEAMVESIQRPERYHAYGQNSRALSLQYSVTHCADEYSKLYLSLCGS